MLAQEHGAHGLGAEHAVEGLGHLVLDELILDDAGAVDDAVDAPEPLLDFFENAGHRRAVADVRLIVVDTAAGLGDARQVGADLPVLYQA